MSQLSTNDKRVSKRKCDASTSTLDNDNAPKRRKLNNNKDVLAGYEAQIKTLQDQISTKDDFIEDLITNTKNIEQKYITLDNELKDIHAELAIVRGERNEFTRKYGLLMKSSIEYGVMHYALDLLKIVNLPGGCNKACEQYNKIIESVRIIRKSVNIQDENTQKNESIKHLFDMCKKSSVSVSNKLAIENAVAGDLDKITNITNGEGEQYEKLRKELLTRLIVVVNFNNPHKSPAIQHQRLTALNSIKLMSSLGYIPATEEFEKIRQEDLTEITSSFCQPPTTNPVIPIKKEKH